MRDGIDILLVEDDPGHAKMTRLALRSTEPAVRVHHVTDGDVALDYLFGRDPYTDRRKYPMPQLVLLDNRMSRVDGVDVLKRLRADRQWRSLVIVMLTTSDRSDDIRSCYDLGANAYLTKPLDFAEFQRKIDLFYRFWAQAAELSDQ